MLLSFWNIGEFVVGREDDIEVGGDIGRNDLRFVGNDVVAVGFINAFDAFEYAFGFELTTDKGNSLGGGDILTKRVGQLFIIEPIIFLQVVVDHVTE